MDICITLLRLICFGLFLGSFAQVSNDDAVNAINLPVDGSLHHSSSTACTLDMRCLNQVLTSKCLVYHNDQWFTFTTTAEGDYYLVVQSQECRDINGVQVVVFDGTLCQPSSYSLIGCVSLATQDDVYMHLKKLKANYTYIVNLDGYLNDFCSFDIRISSTIPDFAILPLEKKSLTSSAQLRGDSIHFSWMLDEDLQKLGIVEFEIMRRYKTEKKMQSIAMVDVVRTVKGDFQENYVYADTVNREGFYYYKIVGKRVDGKKYLILEKEFNHKIINTKILRPQLHFKNHTEIIVEIFNDDVKPDLDGIAFSGKSKSNLLMNYSTTYFESGPLFIDMSSYVAKGIKKIRVVVSDSKRKVKEEFFYEEK